MDNSNKAIAKRINKELNSRPGWTQARLLRKLIKYKNPNISDSDLGDEVIKRKGNFSTTLKGNSKRPIPKEDLYYISKIFGLPLEYIWFGDEKKSGFVPKGARYTAYQDDESAYRTYIADLEYEDKVQRDDELGFNLFDYFGQFDSINGYRFFEKNYKLYFDYELNNQLMYINSDGQPQYCSFDENDYSISNNLLTTLVKYNDVKLFKKIFFDNCSLKRFDMNNYHFRDRTRFDDYFLETLLQNEPFLDLAFKTKELDISIFYKHYDKGENRLFVEPMFFEALDYALKHEDNYKEQLLKMLHFALDYSKHQFEFVSGYLKIHNEEYTDVFVERYSPTFLKTGRSVPMGNVFNLKVKSSDKEINDLLNKIEQFTFNITHIINKQEKKNEEIIISAPDNPLFMELSKTAIEQNVDFVPKVVHADKEFVYFHHYEATGIDFKKPEHLQFIIDCLESAQKLVAPKQGKVLVHGGLYGQVLMTEKGKVVGLAKWENCHYGSKYEDRAELLSTFDDYVTGEEYIKRVNSIFDIISQGLTQEEKIILIDRAIILLNEKRKDVLKEEYDSVSRAYWLKERSAKLEFFKEIILEK